MNTRRQHALIGTGILSISLILAAIAWIGARAETGIAAPARSATADCGFVSCTIYLPATFGNFPAAWPIEMTQGVQQPDNSILLIRDRSTFARLTITSTVAHAGVNALLYGSRDGSPLPGSPLSALNNPRTLKSTMNRGALNDTFNFQLPASWLNGTISLYGYATNGSSFTATGGTSSFTFTYAAAMLVTVVPIRYHCNGGGSVLPGDPPYSYLTTYTHQVYPVPSISLSVHATVDYSGPCLGGVPIPYHPTLNPSGADWYDMLDLISTVRANDGNPGNSYYYGLLQVECSSGCIAGLGWIGGTRAAVGFDGFGSQHSDASETHAHEVGHNHGRSHAPGCGAAGSDPSFPYVPGDGKARIGDSASQNFGFHQVTQALYPYSSTYDIMSYCGPQWVSDYTYNAFFNYDQALAATDEPGPRGGQSLLVSGSIDPTSGMASFRPAFVLNAAVRLPEPGDHILELLAADGRVLAAHAFRPMQAQPDSLRAGVNAAYLGFHMTVPYVDGIASIRIRRGAATLGKLDASAHFPTLRVGAPTQTDAFGVTRVSWRASDADNAALSYLVRASTDQGQTWQTIGVRLASPFIDLRPGDLGGEQVLIEVLASDGLNTTSLTMGPYAVPRR